MKKKPITQRQYDNDTKRMLKNLEEKEELISVMSAHIESLKNPESNMKIEYSEVKPPKIGAVLDNLDSSQSRLFDMIVDLHTRLLPVMESQSSPPQPATCNPAEKDGNSILLRIIASTGRVHLTQELVNNILSRLQV